MFTGIVESIGKIKKITPERGNLHLHVGCDFLSALKVDQSIAHNGCCLTVVDLQSDHYTVTVIEESLKKTNLSHLKEGDFVNLERCMKLGDRLDGHLVQGHVDQVAVLEEVIDQDGSYLLRFQYENKQFQTVEKGSICVNGVSLTVVESQRNSFCVALIPYTWSHTNFSTLKQGDLVNLEFDIIGKYIAQLARNA